MSHVDHTMSYVTIVCYIVCCGQHIVCSCLHIACDIAYDIVYDISIDLIRGIRNSKLHLLSGSHYPASASTTMLFNNLPSPSRPGPPIPPRPSPRPALPMYFKSLTRWAANRGSMLKIVACMLRHYAVAAAAALRGGSRHCCIVWQPPVMRFTRLRHC